LANLLIGLGGLGSLFYKSVDDAVCSKHGDALPFDAVSRWLYTALLDLPISFAGCA